MAENTDNQQDNSAKSLDDELDMILDNVAGSEPDKDDDSLMNDDDAIDQLLMDDEFAEDEFAEDEFADDEEIVEAAKMDELNDEFSDQEESDGSDDLADINELFNDVTRLEDIESVRKNDFTDTMDESLPEAETNSELEDGSSEPDSIPAEQNNIPDQEFDISEFDISSEDDTIITQVNEKNDELSDLIDDLTNDEAGFSTSTIDEFSDDNDEEPLEGLEPESEPELEPEPEPEPIEELLSNSTEISDAFVEMVEGLKAEVIQLKAEQEILKEELTGTSTGGVTASMDEETLKTIEQLQAEQKKINKIQSIAGKKKPVLSYIALAFAIVALLAVAGVAFIGLDNTQVTNLTEQVQSILEQNTYKEVLAVKDALEDNNTNLGALNKRVQQLVNKAKLDETGAVVATLRDDVAELVAKQEKMNADVLLLQEKIGTLEKRRTVSARKSAKKVIKADWSVVLVSFKQAWYAKRKAAEYEKQGVSVEVTPVQIKGVTWHRLRVTGFKTKEKASAEAEKLKKKLNLTSVWVTQK